MRGSSWYEAQFETDMLNAWQAAMNTTITGSMMNGYGPVTIGEPYKVEPCTFTWGDHHCDLMASDHKIHQCGLAPNYDCQYDEDAPPEERIRFWFDDTWEWSDWEGYEEGVWR